MHVVTRQAGPHAQQLERYLGADHVERMVKASLGWYGPALPVLNIPTKGEPIRLHGDGGFSGRLHGQGFYNLADYWVARAKERIKRMLHGRALRAGFASYDELLSAATTGQRREWLFQKAGPTGVAGISSTLFRLGNTPSAGAAASNAPGGDAPTDATAGGIPFDNPTGGATSHLVGANPAASVAGQTLFVYDRIFEVNKTMSSNATEAVTGVPTRYQSTTATDPDYAGGNFMFPEVQVALGATGHNWTVCKYTSAAGTTGQSAPSMTGVSSAIINRLDTTLAGWFMPLAAGDDGLKAITQLQCSASVTGTLAFVMGHALAFMPIPAASCQCTWDGLNAMFSMPRIFDDACISFLELCKPSTTATSYYGSLVAVRH